MLECLDAVITDCLHYYGVDITTMPGHRAIPMVRHLPYYWSVIPDTDPPAVRSAVFQTLEPHLTKDDEDEAQLMDISDIAAFGGDYRGG